MKPVTTARGGSGSDGNVHSPVLSRETIYAQLAAEQYGLVTSAQLSRLGLSTSAISRRVRAGLLIKVLPGVYRIASVPRSWHQRAMAVYLWAGETSAIAGTAAAALHKLDGCPLPSRITVVTNRGLKPPTPLIVVRRPRVCRDRLHEFVHRIRVTDCVRTIIDLAAEVSDAQLELAVEDARRRRLVTPAAVEQRLAEGPLNQPGRGKLLRLIAMTAGTRPTDSGLEVKVLRLLRQHGYPEPIRQEVLNDDGEFAGRVDLAYPERRLIIEVQSYRWHDDRRHVDDDSARGNRHLAMGWVVLRATKKMLSGQHQAAFLRDLHRIYHRPLHTLPPSTPASWH